MVVAPGETVIDAPVCVVDQVYWFAPVRGLFNVIDVPAHIPVSVMLEETAPLPFTAINCINNRKIT
jgi:hypothetical protein